MATPRKIETRVLRGADGARNAKRPMSSSATTPTFPTGRPSPCGCWPWPG